MENTTKIQTVKSFLNNYSFEFSKNDTNKNQLVDEANTIIELVAIGNFGFASEIATTVNKFKRISEKQAYWIAKIAIENNLDNRIEFLYN
jgi:hypothetical protein